MCIVAHFHTCKTFTFIFGYLNKYAPVLVLFLVFVCSVYCCVLPFNDEQKLFDTQPECSRHAELSVSCGAKRHSG